MLIQGSPAVKLGSLSFSSIICGAGVFTTICER